MSSFLDKLKGTASVEEDAAIAAKEDRREKRPVGFIQLEVDIYRTKHDFVIFALVPGVLIEDLDINIEEDNDIVTIQGKRIKPTINNADKTPILADDIAHVKQELLWGAFYRQIILPQEVNVEGVEAKLNKGILMIRLPLLKLDEGGKKHIVITESKQSK